MKKEALSETNRSQGIPLMPGDIKRPTMIFTSVRFRREFDFEGAPTYPIAIVFTDHQLEEYFEFLVKFGAWFTPEAKQRIRDEVERYGRAELI